MQFKNESIFKQLLYTFMVLDFIIPYFVIDDLNMIPGKFMYLAFLLWMAFIYMAPVLLSKLIVRLYIIKNEEDTENVFIVSELLHLAFVLSVFVCSMFYLIMFMLPRQ